jgi:hypothetical protein
MPKHLSRKIKKTKKRIGKKRTVRRRRGGEVHQKTAHIDGRVIKLKYPSYTWSRDYCFKENGKDILLNVNDPDECKKYAHQAGYTFSE